MELLHSETVAVSEVFLSDVCIVASQAAMTLLSVAPMLSGGKSPHPKQHRLQGALSITVERLLFSNLQIQIPSFYLFIDPMLL